MLYPESVKELEEKLEFYSARDLELKHMSDSIDFQINHADIAERIRKNLWYIPQNRQRLSGPFVTSVIAYLFKTQSIVI